MLMSMHTPQNATVFQFVGRQLKKDTPDAVFSYRVHFEGEAPLEFTETITFEDVGRFSALPEGFTERMLEDLHLVLGISYYKLFCPARFAGTSSLTPAQADFWNTVYVKGLGEFLYRNDLKPSVVAQFEASGDANPTGVQLAVSEKKVLIGIGGGKDSIVSLELLREYDRVGLVVETGRGHHITDEVAQIANVPLSKIKRTLDPQLLSGVPGSYNGHVPVSAVYAFLGLLEAALSGARYFVVSNEHSSNFGNVVHEGMEVNHKWSGSVEFERLMQEYVRNNLTTSIGYFSLTRAFYELRVVQLFTELGERYFHTFSSCNRNFTHHHDGARRWCGECPKCAFAFLMLTAFLSKDVVHGIFKKDLFEDASLIPLFKDLLGYGDLKPFDCVGTFEESRVALSLASENGYGDSLIVRTLVPLLDEPLSTEVFKVQKADTVPSRFRLLGMKSALILGYGTEGRATETYLRSRYDSLRIGVADQNDGPAYAEKQHEYDITIKTPSIPKEVVVRQSLSATALFFAEVPRTQIIGVTGSKGKSTTSTLIHRMLQQTGRRVRLVGNIGKSALESLEQDPVEVDELFVFELSSYQLEDLDVSPHIAVVTSLFPEHLDHHGSLEAYYAAKQNIVRFQEASDVLIYTGGFAEVEQWAQEGRAQAIKAEPLPFTSENVSLRGAHMKQNAALAYQVAQRFGVSNAQAQEVLTSFEGLPHRLQHIGTYQGIAFYDDSISTTPESAIAGIRALGDVETIVLGGVDRGYEFALLEKELRASGVRNVVLFPESGERMLTSEEGFRVLHTSSMEEAVQFAYAHTQEGKSCLLSPAAPSYNLYKNFEARGEAFKAAVRAHIS